MFRKVMVSWLIFGLFAGATVSGKEIPALKEVKSQIKPESFSKLVKVSTAKKPLEIGGKAELAKFFSEKEVNKLVGEIDFSTQKMIVFAWRGSGRDKIDFVILESFPEKVSFSYKMGRTRDLRSHVKIYALRKNVTIQ